MSRDINAIAQEFHSTGLTDQQTKLLFELLAAKSPSRTREKKSEPQLSSLPIDWQPSASHYDWATAHGRDRSWVDSIAEDLRNWATAKGVQRASWPGTFSTFMKKAIERTADVVQLQRPGGSTYSAPKRMLGGGYA